MTSPNFKEIFDIEEIEVVPLERYIAHDIEERFLLEDDEPGNPVLVGLVFSNGRVYVNNSFRYEVDSDTIEGEGKDE